MSNNSGKIDNCWVGPYHYDRLPNMYQGAFHYDSKWLEARIAELEQKLAEAEARNKVLMDVIKEIKNG